MIVKVSKMTEVSGVTNRDMEVRLPRATKVKNKQAADKQVGQNPIDRIYLSLSQQGSMKVVFRDGPPS